MNMDMFDEVIKDAIGGAKALLGRVIAIVVAFVIAWLAGIGITLPGEPVVTPEPTPIAEPTETNTPEPTPTLPGTSTPLPLPTPEATEAVGE